LPRVERDYLQIERKYIINSELYTFLMQKLAEAGIAKASVQPDQRVIDPARTDRIPVAPKTSLNYAIALLLGLVLPGGYVLLRDYFRTRIDSIDDLKSL